MSKIGTFEDFRKFAIDKTNVSSTAFDKTFKAVYPTIIEERESSMRISEMNVFSRLIQDRIIFLSGVVNETSMDTIVAQLLYLDSVDNRDINLYINSGGGSCYDGLELISVMGFIGSPVSTTILGMAASMAAVIASSGEKGKRYALPYSRFMVHQPLSDFGHSRFTDSKIALQEMESVRNDLYEILANNSGHSFDEIVEMCEHGDKFMKPQEAIELGFIDEIINKK